MWDLMQTTYDFSPRLGDDLTIDYPDKPDSEDHYNDFRKQYA